MIQSRPIIRIHIFLLGYLLQYNFRIKFHGREVSRSFKGRCANLLLKKSSLYKIQELVSKRHSERRAGEKYLPLIACKAAIQGRKTKVPSLARRPRLGQVCLFWWWKKSPKTGRVRLLFFKSDATDRGRETFLSFHVESSSWCWCCSRCCWYCCHDMQGRCDERPVIQVDKILVFDQILQREMNDVE